ncbi:Aldo/keto reductase [Viridothelium virens]|uniref:Aldo/keto reductase n=1 Tax=Viridothelium virens TaxID=1048519 RepID=A0A6A6HFJ7_VIRVR|nr:Aldo/keto reductase [Viridothelium virens]
MADTVYTLNTGAQIPALGLGTWQSDPGQVKAAVSHAIQKGYRHIDCAYVYDNEDEVGQGIKDGLEKSGIKREDLFVTTKLWCTYHSRVEENLDKSLKSLGLEYVDLYLMHWPVPMNPKGNNEKFPKLPDGSRDLDESWSHLQTWRELEKLPTTGKVRAIGVSNYSVKYLEQLLSVASVTPAANQIENHPYLPQQEIVDFCKSKGILVEAYSPLGSTGSPLFQEQGVQEVAAKHKVTAGAVLLSYHIARGLVVLAKSVTPSRIEENRNVIKLDSTDVAALDKISNSKGITRYVYPAFGVNVGFPDKPDGKILKQTL